MKKFFGFTLAMVTFVTFWGLSAQAQQNDAIVNCSVISAEAQNRVACDTRLLQPTKIKRFSLKANGQELPDQKFETFDDLDSKSAWLFLIDRSNPKRAKTVKKNIELVKSIVSNARSNQSFGIATFAGDLKEIVSLGDRNANIDRRLGDVKADGAATEFFATALEGIRLLSEYDADRRALVVLSDGKAEDKAYQREDVVTAARKAGVIIYGMGFAERPSDTPDLQVLKRLAEETGGPYGFSDGKNPFPEEYISDFRNFLENGGSISADGAGIAGETDIELTLELRNGKDISHKQKLIVDVVSADQDKPLSAIARIYQSFEFAIPNASKWAEANRGLATAALILLAMVILILLYRMIGRKSEADISDETEPGKDVNSDEGTRVVSTPVSETNRAVLGYFEMLGDQTNRFEIRETAVTIGRHSDNDYQLNNDSVHRHHAHFHISPQNIPVISDLDTVNGVSVNDNRVNKAELADGDIIELGEVKFRYIAAVTEIPEEDS